MKKLLKVLFLIPCLVFLVNCSKSSDKKSNYNQCYNQAQGGQTYYNQNCQMNGNNGGYYQANGQCYSQQGQVVQPTYCQNSGGGYAQQCNGWYYYQGQPVYCSGQNCAGYTLQNQSGQSVNCQ